MSPTCPLSTQTAGNRGQWEKMVEGMNCVRVPMQRSKEKPAQRNVLLGNYQGISPNTQLTQLSGLLVLIISAHNEQHPEVFWVKVLYNFPPSRSNQENRHWFKLCYTTAPWWPQPALLPVLYFCFLLKLLKALVASITHSENKSYHPKFCLFTCLCC